MNAPRAPEWNEKSTASGLSHIRAVLGDFCMNRYEIAILVGELRQKLEEQDFDRGDRREWNEKGNGEN